MKEYLRKLKLVDTLSMEIDISQIEFVEKLQNIVDKGSIGLFAEPFEMLNSGKNEYKGQVNFEGFKIRKRRKFFDSISSISSAEGAFFEQNSKLRIDIEINCFSSFLIPVLIFLVILYSISLVTILGSDGETALIAIPFLLIHGTILTTLPYFMMRRSIQKLKYDLEREFIYISRK